MMYPFAMDNTLFVCIVLGNIKTKLLVPQKNKQFLSQLSMWLIVIREKKKKVHVKGTRNQSQSTT